ncbi:flagellar type III secretion system protein FliR [Halopseudomonas aestusnigri]|jgi:flagellar biosynthesis protein FliR|uniref:flagellar biosynthetic protein FliR n=1 Tax=Halopseudomonas aestusnigri TaxID=857252 RepID=UPI000C3D7706|nr:flagellar biosynthetic protein FliR [Halopseudomonas aestusnigri]MAP76194.1 flagellar biosynthetic protein FliR [Pseudomonadales bacterium]MEE2800503.1 flagellar biosynthetic protein FliR [Pseudomonadota bacterium]HBT57161.1 flagellar biosynthetic protein FliR [Pseudomonas sp.]MAY08195.1 flagellar biosynthetic protein FliR [Pseudomonadales bacterium]MCC4262026.1 flagellar type III secretion system protein FliR [Halopseudomonas aestusnigri]|tara:strand:+ start:8324 stop:9100 length:777 start_codon:yes stop_codon:yes gene_type:complete
MIELSSAELSRWVASYLWVLFRIASLLMTMPVLGTQLLPVRVRLYFALALTLLIAPQVGEVPLLDALSLSTWIVIGEQILIGAAMGFSLQLLFQVHVLAGQIIAMQMGLGFASMNDPSTGISVAVVAQVFTMLVTLLFLAMNGHLVVLEVLAESFTTLPIGDSLGRMDFQALVLRFSWVMAAAILIGMPAITALLIVNISFGVMMRAAPQLNIFSIGFPLTLVFGLFIMWVMMGNVLGQYQELASDALIWLRGLVRAS